jgi:hypothetical protein
LPKATQTKIIRNISGVLDNFGLDFTPTLMKYLLFAGLVVLFFAACSKKFKAESLPTKQIIFGTGGGVAGIEKRFILLENGQLFVQKGMGIPVEQPKMPKKVAKALYKKVAVVEMPRGLELPIKNVYQFIECPVDTSTVRLAWSGVAPEGLPPATAALYEELMRAVSTMPSN